MFMSSTTRHRGASGLATVAKSVGYVAVLLMAACRGGPALAPPELVAVRTPFSAVRPTASFVVGKHVGWVMAREDAVWATGLIPDTLQRIDTRTNTVTAKLPLAGEGCASMTRAFGSLWLPVCGKRSVLLRIDESSASVRAELPIAAADSEGGIVASADSLWLVTDSKGVLSRIDPTTNSVRQRISVPPGSANMVIVGSVIWMTNRPTNALVAVDADRGNVIDTIRVGPKPRFIVAAAGSIWTLNQGDGSVTRVDSRTHQVVATIPLGIPGIGGELCSGGDYVWATMFDVPLTAVDPATNSVKRQWVGKGGDSLACGSDSVWVTDFWKGRIWRIPYADLLDAL